MTPEKKLKLNAPYFKKQTQTQKKVFSTISRGWLTPVKELTESNIL